MTQNTVAWQGQAKLACLAREKQTADCVSFELAAPEGQHFQFQPGQFLCLGGAIDGRQAYRPYSIASSPSRGDRVVVAIRRVSGGVVSNWLLDHLQPGQHIDALSPAGEFFLDTATHRALAAPARHVALFSAGCGITPMMAMSHWLLEHSPETHIHFVHSARSEDDLIFRVEVEDFVHASPQFHLQRFLTAPRGDIACHHGRLDAARIAMLIPSTPALQAYLCGPEGYMDLIEASLRAQGVPAAAIFRESFAAPAAATGGAPDNEQFSLTVPAFSSATTISGQESLLDALEREGLPILAACRSGVCGSCRCRVSHGEVTAETHGPLSEEDQAAGYVLACSTRARSDLTLELS